MFAHTKRVCANASDAILLKLRGGCACVCVCVCLLYCAVLCCIYIVSCCVRVCMCVCARQEFHLIMLQLRGCFRARARVCVTPNIFNIFIALGNIDTSLQHCSHRSNVRKFTPIASLLPLSTTEDMPQRTEHAPYHALLSRCLCCGPLNGCVCWLQQLQPTGMSTGPVHYGAVPCRAGKGLQYKRCSVV